MIERVYWLNDDDARQVAELGEKFYAMTKLPGEFHSGTFLMVWNQMLRAGVAIMWVCREEGRIIGSIGFIMSMGLMDGKITMEETFWFVDPDHRGMAGVRLFNEMKKHVQDSHIERVLMANMSGLNEARTEKFYERHGFVKLQTLYRLDL